VDLFVRSFVCRSMHAIAGENLLEYLNCIYLGEWQLGCAKINTT